MNVDVSRAIVELLQREQTSRTAEEKVSRQITEMSRPESADQVTQVFQSKRTGGWNSYDPGAMDKPLKRALGLTKVNRVDSLSLIPDVPQTLIDTERERIRTAILSSSPLYTTTYAFQNELVRQYKSMYPKARKFVWSKYVSAKSHEPAADTFVFQIRNPYINHFLIPILESSCSPFCIFQNSGSENVTSDIDITIQNTKSGRFVHIAQFITNELFREIFHEGIIDGIDFTFGLSDFMDVNFYTSGYHSFCIPVSKNVLEYPSFTSIEFCMKNYINSATNYEYYKNFFVCQFTFAMIRLRLGVVDDDLDDNSTDFFTGFLTNLDVITNPTRKSHFSALKKLIDEYDTSDPSDPFSDYIDFSRAQLAAGVGNYKQIAKEASERFSLSEKSVNQMNQILEADESMKLRFSLNKQDFVQSIKYQFTSFSGTLLNESARLLQARKDKDGSKARVLNYLTQKTEKCMRMYAIRMHNLHKYYKDEINKVRQTDRKTRAALSDARFEGLKLLNQMYTYEYWSLQSMSRLFEEGALYTVGGWLHVVAQKQRNLIPKKNLLTDMYVMSVLENIGFFLNSSKAKYIHRIMDAVKHILQNQNPTEDFVGHADIKTAFDRLSIDENGPPLTILQAVEFKQFLILLIDKIVFRINNLPADMRIFCYTPPRSDEKVFHIGDEVEEGVIVGISTSGTIPPILSYEVYDITTQTTQILNQVTTLTE